MDIKDLFNMRDSSYVRLNNAADYLGRALRENVAIFEIDDSSKRITFLSESQNLLNCKYTIL